VNCADIRNLLPEYGRGGLTKHEESLVEQHLKSCKTCPQELTALQELYAHLDLQSTEKPSEQYWTALLPRIHQRIGERNESGIPVWIRRVALPLSLALLIVAIVIQLSSVDRTASFAVGVRSVLHELDSLELEEIADDVLLQDVVVRDGEENDKELLKELMADANLTVIRSYDEMRTFTENLNDEDAEMIVARLNTKWPFN
jgi:predicted anti-sigma-YlaC factor YlaD